MSKRGSKYLDNNAKIDKLKDYDLSVATDLIKSFKPKKFDETIDIAVSLGVDPRHADQLVRGTVALPHGTGKDVTIVVMAKGEFADQAKEAGADYIGSDDLVEKIKNGWVDFDVLIATPDLMSEVGKLGKILGPRGLMPNPKVGTVTREIEKTVKEIKAGKIEYKVDKSGIVHSIIGKQSFPSENLADNISVFMKAIVKARPSASKGTYIKKISISTSMGPGIKLNKMNFIG